MTPFSNGFACHYPGTTRQISQAINVSVHGLCQLDGPNFIGVVELF